MTSLSMRATIVGNTKNIVQIAVDLGNRGYWVLPIKPQNKAPWTPRGYKSARNQEDKVRELFEGKDNCNLGISTHIGLVVVDIDPRNGGNDSFQTLIEKHGHFPQTVACTTAGGGMHYYFRVEGSFKGRSNLKPGIDIKAQGGYVVAPPSVNGSGGKYEWIDGQSPFDIDPAPIPSWLLHMLKEDDNQAAALNKPSKKQGNSKGQNSKQPSKRSPSNPPQASCDVSTEGFRNTTLTSMAGGLNRLGLDPAAILNALREHNRIRCSPPLPDEEVSSIVDSICKYPSEDPIGTKNCIEPSPKWVAPDVSKVTIDEVLDVYTKMMPGADPGMLRVSLAAYAANWLDKASPVWLMLVSGPSTGKTRTLTALKKLPAIQSVSSLSAPALIPGTPKQYCTSESTGGILLEPKGFSIIICDDFSRTLSMEARKMSKLFATLADVNEGRVDRPLGGNGGFNIHWEGKRGFLIGATPKIDTLATVLKELAPRFLTYRRTPYELQEGDNLLLPEEEDYQHKMLTEMIPGVFSGVQYLHGSPPQIPDEDRANLQSLARLLADARIPIERDEKDSPLSSLEPIPSGRPFGYLVSLYRGYIIIGVDPVTAMQDITRVVLSTVGPPRSDVISTLLDPLLKQGESAIRGQLKLSKYITHKAISDLVDLTVLQKTGKASGSKYSLQKDYRRVLRHPSLQKELRDVPTAPEADSSGNTLKLFLEQDVGTSDNSTISFMQFRTHLPSSRRVVGQ